MNSRQEKILKCVIDEYVSSAEPVGSRFLCETYSLNVSPATIRNDMVALEQEGFLRQPHTSAGRIPTELAYQYYLKNFKLSPQNQMRGHPLRSAVVQAKDESELLKTLAKKLVNLSGEAAIVAFDPGWSYYTGVSNLFHKPDFNNLDHAFILSETIDRFDEVICKVFDSVSDKPLVLIGTENPFGELMSTILIKYHLPELDVGLIGLIGPLRMNYQKNIALVERAKEVLDSAYE